MKKIDYNIILKNIDISLNAMEYDALRSAGKTKFNAATLNELYALKAHLKVLAAAQKPAPKPTPLKEEK